MISIGQTLPKPSIKIEFKHSIKYLLCLLLLLFFFIAVTTQDYGMLPSVLVQVRFISICLTFRKLHQNSYRTQVR